MLYVDEKNKTSSTCLDTNIKPQTEILTSATASTLSLSPAVIRAPDRAHSKN